MTKKKYENEKSANKKVAYISFGVDESAILRTLGYRERSLYFELKWLANFKTGTVGNFHRMKITYELLAEKMTLPSSQGKPGDKIDGKEASRCLMRLIKAGLVGEIEERDNGGLIFCLPLSPIHRDLAKMEREAARIQEGEEHEERERQKSVAREIIDEIELSATDERLPKTTGEAVWRLPEIKASDKAALSDLVKGFGKMHNSVSVLPIQEEDNTFSSSSVNNGAGETPAPRCPSSEPHPPSLENKDPRGGYTAAEVESMLMKKGFLFASNDESIKLYERWVKIGVHWDAIIEAAEMIDSDFSADQTPRAIDKLLRKQFAKEHSASTHRHSGVAL